MVPLREDLMAPISWRTTRRGTAAVALLLLLLMVFPGRLECSNPSCQIGNEKDDVDQHCPVKLTQVNSTQEPGESYSEYVTLHVWIKAHDFCEAPKIEILSQVYRPVLRGTHKCLTGGDRDGVRVRCQRDSGVAVWEFVYDSIKVEAQRRVSVSYSTTSRRCSRNYTVEDPVPEFNLTVNPSSKTVTVTVQQRGESVHIGWCYKINRGECFGGENSTRITMDPAQSGSAVLLLPHLLPCVCVEVYYTFLDAMRVRRCPFESERILDVADVWGSSKVRAYESSLEWSSVCPADGMNISAVLCWKQQDHGCIRGLNSTLKQQHLDGWSRIYDVSTVDKHPHMCVQFSLQGSRDLSCPFEAETPSWEVKMASRKQSVLLYLTSSAPATFSSQLCVVREDGCSPVGSVQTLQMEGTSAEMRIKVSSHFLLHKPCVQVWQSLPARHGTRVLCPDYTHTRRGVYASAALTALLLTAALGLFIHRLTRSGAAGLLHVQKPVLLVCSSDRSAHVSAVCTLASVLQGELHTTLHLSLWAQSSQKQDGGAGAGVADVGPLPWLYGQWESVREARGKVLIVWSPEARTSYDKWRETANVNKSDVKTGDEGGDDVKEDFKHHGRKFPRCKKEKSAGGEDCVGLGDEGDWYQQREPSSVIGPMFAGALSCLQGSLQRSSGQEVAIVYFQGLGHSRDIPSALRRVPRYCLPQDFRGLLQELGGMTIGANAEVKGHCWHRLVAKVQSVWLARQLTHRLQTLLPQRRSRNAALSQERTAERTLSRAKSPPASDEESSETAREREPLHRPSLRPEEL